MHPILLLVTLVSFGSISYGFSPGDEYIWNHFEFDITLFCNDHERKEYNLMIEWWEDDTLPGKEQISGQKFFRAPTGNFSFSMDGAMNGDELFSDGYKPIAYITHNCERFGEQVELEMYVTPLCKLGSGCHYRIVEDITSRKGKHYITAKGLKIDDWTPFPDFKPYKK